LIKEQTIDTLKSFYNLMAQTREVRFDIVNQLLSFNSVSKGQYDALQSALRSLEMCLKEEHKTTLKIDGSEDIDVDLTVELLNHSPQPLYLVLTSRREPPLPLTTCSAISKASS